MSTTDPSENPAPEPRSPRIIVDDDWKEQVEREKQAAKAAAAAPTQPAPEVTPETTVEPLTADSVAKPTSDEPASTATRPDQNADLPPPPEASFETLVSMLFTQTMAALGQFPDPDGSAPEINKPYAKHFIDTLDMLSEKTKGNLSEDEAKLLSEALHTLRMAFVSIRAKR